MGKGIQTNIRLNSEIHAILQHIADETNISLSSLTAKIITDYVQFYYYKIERGDVTISQPILRKLIDGIDNSRIDEIAEFNAQHIVSEIKVQEAKVTYEIFVERALKWNKGNHLLFKRIKQIDSDIFVSKHSLGKQWSELQCKTYAKAFEKIGQTVLETTYDSEESFTLEIVNHEH